MNKIIKKLQILLCCMVAVLSTSCATMFSPVVSQKLKVKSDVPLKVRLVNEKTGERKTFNTPFTHNLKGDANYTIQVISDLYESEYFSVNHTFNKAAIFNVFSPLWIGFYVDFTSGNLFKHERLNVFIDSKDLVRKKAMGEDEFKAKVKITIEGHDEGEEPAKAQITIKKLKFKKIVDQA